MKTMSAHSDAVPEARIQGRLMVDAPTRAFHWLLALCFVGAYVTSESERWRLIHITLGYTALGLVAFRLLWSLIGPRPVRWQTWRSRVQAAARQLRDWRWNGPKWSTKLVAMNTVAILALILGVTMVVATGVALDQEWWGDALEEVHEVLGNSLLLVVFTHVGLVLLSSWVKAGLPWQAMVTGRVSGPGPNLVSAPRRWLALVLFAAVVGFWYQQWQSAPQASRNPDGPSMSQNVGEAGGHDARHDDDDDQDDD